MRFEIVEREADHSPGTVKGGDGSCPFPECRRTIDGDEIKAQAQAGRMGHQLYCVVYKEERIKGYTKNGKPKTEKVIRASARPGPEDDVEVLVKQKLGEAKCPCGKHATLCRTKRSIPFRTTTVALGCMAYRTGQMFFSPRQLYGHCVASRSSKTCWQQCARTDLDRAAMAYIALAIDKMVNYNAAPGSVARQSGSGCRRF